MWHNLHPSTATLGAAEVRVTSNESILNLCCSLADECAAARRQ